MSEELVLQLVSDLLRARGTDVTELEQEIDRLTQPEAAARSCRHAANGPRRATRGGMHRAEFQLQP